MTHAGRVDACPGILELHDAADGALARVRVPGGFVSGAGLLGLADLTAACASGWVELTSRGNLGFRSVSDATALQAGLTSLGLLSADAAYDRARNIVASPLGDSAELVRDLDAGLQATPALAGLSGRFLFGVDDGSGLSETPDVGLALVDDGWQLTVDGWLAGPGSVADVLDAAVAFLDLRSGDIGLWRVRELADGAAGLAASLGRELGTRGAPVADRLALGERYVGSRRVVVVAGWLQRLSAGQLGVLASVLAPSELIRFAAAGRVVVPVESSTAAAVLASSGLIVDAADPRGQVTACSGLGACARATVDVRGLAASLAVPGVVATHLVSCARACGTPADARVEVRWV